MIISMRSVSSAAFILRRKGCNDIKARFLPCNEVKAGLYQGYLVPAHLYKGAIYETRPYVWSASSRQRHAVRAWTRKIRSVEDDMPYLLA